MPDRHVLVSTELRISALFAHTCSAHDQDFLLEERVQALCKDDPYTQIQYYEDLEAQHDRNDRICCVYISNFFADRMNLVYYIKGTRNVERFYGGMSGMQAYNGAALFAISPHNFAYVLKAVKIRRSTNANDRVLKSEMPIESSKWRYIFETGRLVWSKSDIDLNKLQKLMEMESENNESDRDKVTRWSGDDTHVDLRDDPDKEIVSRIGLQDASLHTISTISAVKRGKAKAVDEECYLDPKEKLEPLSVGTLDLRPGGSVSETIVEHSGAAMDTRTLEDRITLEAYKKTKKLSNINQLWFSLKENAQRHPNGIIGITFDSSAKDLTKVIILLEQREKELARRKVTASSMSGNTKTSTELVELEEAIATDRLSVIQRTANASFENWKDHRKKSLTACLHRLQTMNVGRKQIKAYIRQMVMCAGRHDTQDKRNSLEIDEEQTVTNLVDNIELRDEYVEKMKDVESNPMSPEGFAGLEDLGRSLETEQQKYITQLTTTMLKYSYDIHVRSLHSIADKREVAGEELSDDQQNLATSIMETMNWSRSLAIALLQKSDWNPEAAVARWFEGDPGVHCENIRSLPPLEKTGKRSYMATAESESSKRQKKGNFGSQRPVSPEETLEAAQARLTRILTGNDTAALEQTEQPRQKDGDYTAAGPSLSKLRGQKKYCPVSGMYNLGILNDIAPENTKVEAVVSHEKGDTEPSDRSELNDTQAHNDRRYSLRTLNKKVDHRSLHNGIDSKIQGGVETATPFKESKQQSDKVELEPGTLDKTQQIQTSSSHANGPFTNESPHEIPSWLTAGEFTDAPDPRGSVLANQEGSERVNRDTTPSSHTVLPAAPSLSPKSNQTCGYDEEIEGTEPREDQWQSTQCDAYPGTSKVEQTAIEQTHGHTNVGIQGQVARPWAMHRQTYNQPFVPASPSAVLEPRSLDAREGVRSGLRFRSSGDLTFTPQLMPSSETLVRTTVDVNSVDTASTQRDLSVQYQSATNIPPPSTCIRPPLHASFSDTSSTERVLPTLRQRASDRPPLSPRTLPPLLPLKASYQTVSKPRASSQSLSGGIHDLSQVQTPQADGHATATQLQNQQSSPGKRQDNRVAPVVILPSFRPPNMPTHSPLPPLPEVYLNPGGYLEINGTPHFNDLPNVYSPPLNLSSGPSDSSPNRDFSSLSEDSPPPTTHPASAVLGPFNERNNEVVSSPELLTDEKVGSGSESYVGEDEEDASSADREEEV